MSDQNRDDETLPLPADDTQRLPIEDESAERPRATVQGDTQRVPVVDDTQAVPADWSGRADDPLSIFEEPRRTAEPGFQPEVPYGRTAPDTTAPAAPTAPAETATPQRGLRTGTIVWGFLVLALGLGLLADVSGARIDVELAAILLLAFAGAVLVLGSVVSAVRRRRS